MTKSYLTKINDINNELYMLSEKLKLRPTDDEMSEKLSKMNNYTTLEMHKGLARLVSQKAESISFDEVRINTDALTHRCSRIENNVSAL